MLEEYFVKPSTIDRLRGSWIATEIETYVAWLAGQGYSTKSIWRRVPVGFAFGEFARERGAQDVAQLPAHVEAFVADRVAAHHAQTGSARPMAKEVRGPVEQMLSVVLPGFEPTGRRHHPQPFAGAVPGFFGYLDEERGLRPASIYQYRHHLDRFEAYLARIGVRSLGELSPPILSAYIIERASAGLAKSTVRDSAGVLRVFLRYAHREGVLASDLSGAVGWPQIYRLSSHSPLDLLGRRQPGPGQRRPQDRSRQERLRRSCCCSSPTACAAGKSPRSPWTTSTGSASGWRSPSARPATPQRSRCRPSSARRSWTTCATAARRPPTAMSSSAPPRPGRPIGAAAVSALARSYLLKAGVDVPRPGSHTLRHSAVQRLVDADFPLKTIGDFIGHRSARSTEVYAKVAVEALREVALGDGEEVLS